jgi:hypothetical protein
MKEYCLKLFIIFSPSSLAIAVQISELQNKRVPFYNSISFSGNFIYGAKINESIVHNFYGFKHMYLFIINTLYPQSHLQCVSGQFPKAQF